MTNLPAILARFAALWPVPADPRYEADYLRRAADTLADASESEIREAVEHFAQEPGRRARPAPDALRVRILTRRPPPPFRPAPRPDESESAKALRIVREFNRANDIRPLPTQPTTYEAEERSALRDA